MPNNVVRHLFTKTERYLDHATGEITQEKSTHITRNQSEPAYVKFYVEDLSSLSGLNHSQKAQLYQLVLRMTYQGMIAITPLERSRIIESMGISEKTFRNNMTKIIQSGLLYRHSPSDYEANPRFFARGSWKEILDRRQDFELRIRYRADTGNREYTSQGIPPDDDQPKE